MTSSVNVSPGELFVALDGGDDEVLDSVDLRSAKVCWAMIFEARSSSRWTIRLTWEPNRPDVGRRETL